MVQVSEITPYSRNARAHSAAQIAQIVASIREFGFTNPLLVDENNELIAGHGRLAAAQQLGMPQLPAIVLEGLSSAQKQALRIADNKLALNATWDDALLRTELADLRDVGFELGLTGFGEEELLGIFADANGGLTDPDDVPEAPAEPVTQPGDVWLLGRHRLVCGDATNEVDHGVALAGEEPDLVLTDPPYGVGVDYATFADNQEGMAELIPQIMPLLQRWRCILLTPGIPAMWMYPRPDWLLAWIHPAPTSSGPWGFNGLNPVLAYGKDPWLRAGKGRHPDHIVMATDRKGVTGHPAPKPVEAWKWLLERGSVSPRDHIFDPFCGSGTTIIAAEMTGRACHAIEISPAYCDVTIQRWQNFTGQTATRPDGTPYQGNAQRAPVPAD